MIPDILIPDTMV